MENKINIAELLRNCPRGMELDCPMYENLYFDGIDETQMHWYPIKCYTVISGLRTSLTFSKFGEPNKITTAKCVIFPKGKTTWEGFVPHCQFKDGDILFVDCSDGEDKSCHYIFILNKPEFYGKWHSYCHLDDVGSFHSVATYLAYDEDHPRLATEEEKAKLFKVIKDNGYRWNEETKTLEKLVEHRFKVGDRIRHKCPEFRGERTITSYDKSGYWTSINDWIDIAHQDDWELVQDEPKFKDGDVVVAEDSESQLFLLKEYLSKDSSSHDGYCYFGWDFQNNTLFEKGNWRFDRLATKEEREKLFQTIKDNGYHWDEENKTLEKLPIFKVGDRIRYKKNKDDVFKIDDIDMDNNLYCCGRNYIQISYQDKYELVPNKFDVTTLKHFDKVLVRDNINEKWNIHFFSYIDDVKMFKTIMGTYIQCIPYEGNEHLCGTTNSCDDYFKTWKDE